MLIPPRNRLRYPKKHYTFVHSSTNTPLQMKIQRLSLLLAASSLISASCLADTQAFVTSSGTSASVAGTGLVGFEFTLNENIDLTQLGFLAESLGGGDTPHVALLNVTGGATNPPNVLFDTGDILSDMTTSYPAATPESGAPLVFNYVSVGTPILLVTGQTYEITAPAYWTQKFDGIGGDDDLSGFTIGGAIQTASFETGGGWNGWDPNNGSSGQVYNYATQTAGGTYTAGGSPSGTGPVTANFQYTVAAVPEPQTFAMLLGGVAAFFGYQRMRRRF